MNTADLAIAAVLAISVVIGIVRGFVVEAMSLVVWAAALALAFLFGGRVATLFEGSIELASLRIALGHAIVFMATLVAGAVLVWLLRRMVQSTGLSGTDRMLGLVFGLARGGAIVVLLVLLAGLTPFPRDPWWRDSRLLPPFQLLAAQVVPWLPAVLRDNIDFEGEQPAVPAPVPQPAAA
jgi:membrane protein required for colicin V production